MKVTLTEAGGWANARRSCTVDTDTLPSALAARLRDGCLSALSVPAGPPDPRVRDARILTLVVDSGDGVRSASFSEPGAPPELRPVLEILRPLCRRPLPSGG